MAAAVTETRPSQYHECARQCCRKRDREKKQNRRHVHCRIFLSSLNRRDKCRDGRHSERPRHRIFAALTFDVSIVLSNE